MKPGVFCMHSEASTTRQEPAGRLSQTRLIHPARWNGCQNAVQPRATACDRSNGSIVIVFAVSDSSDGPSTARRPRAQSRGVKLCLSIVFQQADARSQGKGTGRSSSGRISLSREGTEWRSTRSLRGPCSGTQCFPSPSETAV